MDNATAEKWVTISALTVAGVYGYRKVIEPSSPPTTLKKLVGVGELPPLGSFATAWGFTFLIVAVITEAAPGLGAAFAILIATSDLLTNSASVFADVGKQSGQPTTTAATTKAQQATVLSDLPPLQATPAFAPAPAPKATS